MKKTLGILGGMGPEATAYFYELIIRKTKVEKDQDHMRVIIWSNPEVPPRTDATLGLGPSPVPLLVEGAKGLVAAGAELIAMPCVSAHYFIYDVQAQVDFQFISLLDESLKWAQDKVPGLKKAGLISSTGTKVSRMFHNTFGRAGIDVLAPDEDEQEDVVMEAIFGKGGIKAGVMSGRPKEMIVGMARALVARGAEAIIAGCTEVPLVLKEEDIPVPLIEPMSITAEACIREAGYEVR